MIRFLTICIIAISSNLAFAQISKINKDSIIKHMKKVADWQIKEFAAGYENTNVYGVGAFLLAGTELFQLTNK